MYFYFTFYLYVKYFYFPMYFSSNIIDTIDSGILMINKLKGAKDCSLFIHSWRLTYKWRLVYMKYSKMEVG